NSIFLAGYLIMVMPFTLWRLLENVGRRVAQPAGSWLGLPVLAALVVAMGAVFVGSVDDARAWWAVPAIVAGFALVAAVLPPLPPTPLGRLARVGAYLALLWLQGLVVILTASRGPLLALVAALLGITAVAAWRGSRWRQLAALGGSLVVLVAG